MSEPPGPSQSSAKSDSVGLSLGELAYHASLALEQIPDVPMEMPQVEHSHHAELNEHNNQTEYEIIERLEAEIEAVSLDSTANPTLPLRAPTNEAIQDFPDTMISDRETPQDIPAGSSIFQAALDITAPPHYSSSNEPKPSASPPAIENQDLELSSDEEGSVSGTEDGHSYFSNESQTVDPVQLYTPTPVKSLEAEQSNSNISEDQISQFQPRNSSIGAYQVVPNSDASHFYPRHSSLVETSDLVSHENLKDSNYEGQVIDDIHVDAPPVDASPILIASDIQPIFSLFQSLSGKFHHCGFIYKKNQLGSDGKLLSTTSKHRGIHDTHGEWVKWWAELWGSVLHLWRVPDDFASFPYAAGISIEKFLVLELDPPLELLTAIKETQEAPVYINVADAISEMMPFNYIPDDSQNCPLPPPPYNSFFSFSNAGSNLILFACSSAIISSTWMAAIRLAQFESFKLSTAFTYTLLERENNEQAWSEFKLEPFKTVDLKESLLFQGQLQIRLPFSSQWVSVYAVMSSQVETEFNPNAKEKKMFGSKKSKRVDSTRKGILNFYDSKASYKKGKDPLFFMTDMQYALALWPEKPELIDMGLVSLGRLGGACHKSADFKDFFLKDQSVDNVIDRSFKGFLDAAPVISNWTELEDLLTGEKDSRPFDSSILILASSTIDLLKWITCTHACFSLDSDPTDSKKLTQVLLGEADFYVQAQEKINPLSPPEPHMKWPSLLYFSVSEVAGFSMLQSADLSFLQMQSCLESKIEFAKRNAIRTWCESVAKGEWERRVITRKNVELKLKALMNWVQSIVAVLKDRGVEIPARQIDGLFSQFIDTDPPSQVKDNPTSELQQEESVEVDVVNNPPAENENLVKSQEPDPNVPIEKPKKPQNRNSLAPDRMLNQKHLSIIQAPGIRTSLLSPGQFIMAALEFVKDGNLEVKSPPPETSSVQYKGLTGNFNADYSQTALAQPKKLEDLISDDTASEDGSQSESENSNEGSQSSDDEDEILGLSVAPHDDDFVERRSISATEEDIEYQDEPFQLYGDKTLLAHDGHRAPVRGPGPLIQVVPDEGVPLKIDKFKKKDEKPLFPQQPVFQSNSLLDRSGQVQHRRETDGPLLGFVNDETRKPKLQAGLLGQVNMREQQKAYWKKMGYQGYIPPTGIPPHQMAQMVGMSGMYGVPPGYPMAPQPGWPPMPGMPPVPGMYPGINSPYNPPEGVDHEDWREIQQREIVKQQFLETERAKERQRMIERQTKGAQMMGYMGVDPDSRSNASSSSEDELPLSAQLLQEESSSPEESDEGDIVGMYGHDRETSGTEDDSDISDQDATSNEDNEPLQSKREKKKNQKDSSEEDDDDDDTSSESSDEPLATRIQGSGPRAAFRPAFGTSVFHGAQPQYSGYNQNMHPGQYPSQYSAQLHAAYPPRPAVRPGVYYGAQPPIPAAPQVKRVHPDQSRPYVSGPSTESVQPQVKINERSGSLKPRTIIPPRNGSSKKKPSKPVTANADSEEGSLSDDSM